MEAKIDIKKLKQQKLKEMLKKKQQPFRVYVDEDSPWLFRDESTCIRCGKCKDVCKDKAQIWDTYEIDKTHKHVCIGCGKCVINCPTGALLEKAHYRDVLNEIENYDKTLVVSVAPGVRVSIAEEFGFAAGLNDEGRLISALRMVGFDYVFDITFGADLTIVEEACELIERKTKNVNLPQFSSCCPAWVNFVEIYKPHLTKNLSTTKSPISMHGAILKTYFAKQKNLNPENIVHVVVAPCIAKKSEVSRTGISASESYHNIENLKDVDYVITTKELAHMIKKLNIPYGNLPEGKFDKMLSRGSGAGMIFGNTGGVTQAVLREVYYQITGENPPTDLLHFEKLRGLEDVKEETLTVGDYTFKIAVCNGIANAKKLLTLIENNEKIYDFVEVMTCEGGCIAGPGQSKQMPLTDELRQKRIKSLYDSDEQSKIRLAHENPEIRDLYFNFLGKPLSLLSKKLLHTSYLDRSKEFKLKEIK